MADFNIDLLRSDTNHQTTYFIHNMFANAFYPTISKPTRVTKQRATLIDNIITNIHEYSIKSGILYNDISDHFPIFTYLLTYLILLAPSGRQSMFLHLTLFWARALASCQVTPTLSRSCSVERLQLIFGLPCLLFPCGL